MFLKVLKFLKLSSDIESISTKELRQDLEEPGEGKVLLDVRTAEEFLSGHIPKAINIDIRSRDFKDQIKQLDQEKTYLVYCRSGVRSLQACKEMGNLGFEKVVNVKGGFVSWMKG